MSLRRSFVLTALLAAALGVSACSTLNRLNPFDRQDEGPQETAGEGQRISIVPPDQLLEPTEALKGVEFSLPPPTPVADWPLPGGTPEQAIGNAEAGGELRVVWRKGFGSGSSRGRYITAPPVVGAGRIYVMDGEGRVAALDARTGAQVWRTGTNPGDNKRDRLAFGGGIAFHEGKLYVSSGFRQMLQLDAATGAIGWRTRTSEAIHGAPTIAAGRVMAVALDNSLLTFDLATGQPGWTFQALAESARILGASSPAVSGDVVVAAFGSGELVAIRAGNGNDLWNEALSRASRTSALSEIRDIPGRPVIYQGDVYAVSHSGVFAAIDLRTGQAKWSLPVVGVSSPWPAGDVVYVVSKTGELVCASRETGQIYWIRDLNEGFKPRRKGGVPGLTMLGLTGQEVARPVWSGPLVANNRVIVVGQEGELVAVNAKTGAIEKRMEVGASSLIAPIAAGDMIYLVTDEAQVIALR